MNGLFAYRDLEVGEILVQYTGAILTQTQANASDSQYLFDVFYRSKPGADTVVRKTIDGRGELWRLRIMRLTISQMPKRSICCP